MNLNVFRSLNALRPIIDQDNDTFLSMKLLMPICNMLESILSDFSIYKLKNEIL